MLGTRKRKWDRRQWKIDLLIVIGELVPWIMGAGLLGAMILPEQVAAVFVWLFLLPFLLIAGALVFGALAGTIGVLLR